MAFAKKCDICGKLYEIYNVRNDINYPNGFMILNIDEHRKYFEHGPIECCPACMKAIENEIENLGGIGND